MDKETLKHNGEFSNCNQNQLWPIFLASSNRRLATDLRHRLVVDFKKYFLLHPVRDSNLFKL